MYHCICTVLSQKALFTEYFWTHRSVFIITLDFDVIISAKHALFSTVFTIFIGLTCIFYYCTTTYIQHFSKQQRERDQLVPLGSISKIVSKIPFDINQFVNNK